jgi:hypothetical protein
MSASPKQIWRMRALPLPMTAPGKYRWNPPVQEPRNEERGS